MAICRHRQAHHALQACAAFLQRYMPVTKMFLEAYEHDFGAIRSLAVATPKDGTPLDLLVPMDPAQRATIQGFRNQAPRDNVFLINYPEEDPVSLAMLAALGEGSQCSILGTYPELDGVVQGAVVVLASGCGQFNEDHARLLGMLKDPFGIALNNALKHREVERLQERLQDDNRYLHREIMTHTGGTIVGADFGLAEVVAEVHRVAIHHSPVLLLGETGVGKDVLANHIHAVSPRSRGPLIRVNCGAIPESLLDSELFGHEKGAFTGATAMKRGRFERADGGTIFLDEIGELRPDAQIRLLRVLQNRELERVGGTESIPVDVRVIAATHRDLRAMVRSGEFREDLWYRLYVFPVRVPPLRERICDIPALVEHFVSVKVRALKLPQTPPITPSAMDTLMAYDWPGNVRELENVIERGLILGGGQWLDLNWLKPPSTATEQSPGGMDGPFPTLDQAMARHIRTALQRAEGRVHGAGGAADLLGINPSTLRSRMRRLGVKFGR